jgi:hypothetical protein
MSILIAIFLLILPLYCKTSTPTELVKSKCKAPMITPTSVPYDLMNYFGYPYTGYVFNSEVEGYKGAKIIKETTSFNFPQFDLETMIVQRLDLSQGEEGNFWVGVGGQERYEILIQIGREGFRQKGGFYEYVVQEDN